MRYTQLMTQTLREVPADAEALSHRWALRAGLIRPLAAGIFSFLPLGLRVKQKIENILREEMESANCYEISMPVVQPAEIWQETGRWNDVGSEMMRMKDRGNRDMCLAMTHEEAVTDLARHLIQSYRQLPLSVFQIQTKFRDERRPRFGVMRAREFVMKDAYSFHTDLASLQQTYELMYQTYSKIFTRLGFSFRAVVADSGNIGGNSSHEFHVLADSGEDEIVFSTEGDYAANMEMATALAPAQQRSAPQQEKNLVHTPDTNSIDEVCRLLQVEADQTLKTLIVLGEPGDSEAAVPLVALILRGDHQLNEVKASKLQGVQSPLCFASEEQIGSALACKPGSIGPVGLPANIKVIVDRDAALLNDFVCGANQDGYHLTGVNWERDCRYNETADLRKVIEGDLSPDGKGQLSIKRGIEVGHIFQLGNKYSKAMQLTILNENGKSIVPEMGCYGIGVTRIVAAAIEQCHDENGINWPENIAPFQLALIPLNAHKSEQVSQLAEKLYRDLSAAGLEVLFDDRDKKTSPGVKFADMELIGIPHRLVISERSLEQNKLEYKHRSSPDSQDIPLETALDFLKEKILSPAKNAS